MRRKRLVRADQVGRPPSVAPPGDVDDEREGLVQFLAPLVFGFGIGLTVLLSWGALIMALGGVGDCFEPACELERQFWADLGTRQAMSWLVAVFGLAFLAHRWNHNLWLLVAVTSAVGMLAGLISIEVDYWDRTPTLSGIHLPVISPAFVAWIPGAFFMAVGSILLWFGARRNRRAHR